MKSFIAFIILILLTLNIYAQQCNQATIVLNSQADVDNFQTNYGPCDSITTSLSIGDYPINTIRDIDDLTPLGIVHTPNLFILGNDNLATLDGLQTLIVPQITKLIIQGNPSLTDVSQLTGIGPSSGDFAIVDNDQLVNLNGLQNIETVGTAFQIRDNASITNVDELINLKRVDRSFVIENNASLSNIDGFSNMINFGTGANPSFIIKDNPLLSDCSPLCFIFAVAIPQATNLLLDIQNNLSDCKDEISINLNCFEINNGIYSGSNDVPSSTFVDLADNIYFDSTALVINGTDNKIGIGTDSPTYELDVMGDIGISGQIYGLSDKNLKHNISPLLNALGLISQLNPTTYDFKTKEFENLNLSDVKQYGLIAQEVETTLPEIVSKMSISQNQEFKSINYNALVTILIGAIKEQQQEIDSLKKQMQEVITKHR